MAKLQSHEDNRAVYTFEIAWDLFDKEVNKVYNKNKNRFQIHGFRKGKATRKIIEMSYGEGVFYEDALNNLLPEYIESASKELELEPIGRPDVDVKKLEKKETIEIEVSTDTKPHPTLADYKGMEVERHPVTVEEAEVDQVISSEQQKNAVIRPVERAAKEGDTVQIDYAGSVDGVAFEGGTAEKQQLELGSGSFIPGFEEQIVGHKAGESFDVNVTFPEKYHAEDLAGKDAVFAVVLHEVQEKDIPEADDDFAQDVSEYDTMKEYRDAIRKDLQEKAEERDLNRRQNDALAKLAEISDVKVPQSMIDDQVEVEIRNMANQLQQMGLSFDQYLQYSGQSIDMMRANYTPMARARVAGDLVLGSLVEEQKFEATEEEIADEMKEIAQTYGAQDPEDFIRRMKEMNQEELVADDIRKKKALDYLLEQVKWVDAPEETKEDTDETKKDDKSVEKESKSGYDKKADKKSAKDKTEEK
ncbi:trigger factor [Levyella massiliensis]|uniref:trigger factor n=1 Tax=Levyella massiliensis TaxID=938289 RepID=UPI0024AD942B|nr:trigger factor [Levyella massiliensis]